MPLAEQPGLEQVYFSEPIQEALSPSLWLMNGDDTTQTTPLTIIKDVITSGRFSPPPKKRGANGEKTRLGSSFEGELPLPHTSARLYLQKLGKLSSWTPSILYVEHSLGRLEVQMWAQEGQFQEISVGGKRFYLCSPQEMGQTKRTLQDEFAKVPGIKLLAPTG